MASISVTRLRLRSFRFFLPFLWYALRSQVQARATPGNRGVEVRRHSGAFWTLTLWDNPSAARSFVNAGAHKKVMPRLMHWCDEASVATWAGEPERDWDAIYACMLAEGRLSRVKNPTRAHQEKRYAPMRRWAPEQRIVRAASS